MNEIERSRLLILAKMDLLRSRGSSLEHCAQKLGISSRSLATWRAWRDALPEADRVIPEDKIGKVIADFTTLELLDELKTRAENVVLAMQWDDSGYFVFAKGDKKVFDALMILIDLKKETS